MKAEIFDGMQYFFGRFNDHQIRARLEFCGELDAERLERAARLSARRIPVLGCRFVPGAARPRWEPAGGADAPELFSFMRADARDAEAQAQRFLTQRPDERFAPQVRVRLLRAPQGDILCVLMNHMVCDGAGFREYLCLLAELYAGNADARANVEGARGVEQLFRRFSPEQKRAAFRKNPAAPAGSPARFPLAPRQPGAVPRILTYTLPRERFLRLKAYGKRRDATVNDTVLTACARALERMPGLDRNGPPALPCMVDLRRYLPGGKAESVCCNLASMVVCAVGETSGEGFDATLARVHARMAEQKSGFPGLAGLYALRAAFALPFPLTCALLGRFYANPLIGVTNIGVLDEKRLNFGDIPLKSAFAAASLKYAPYFQLGFTTFRGDVIFSAGQYCGPGDREAIERFFGLLGEELARADDGAADGGGNGA